MVENYKWNYNRAREELFCAVLGDKTERKKSKKNEILLFSSIHTQFFNILFQWFGLLFVCLRQQQASWSLIQVGRDVDVTVSFFFLLFLYVFRSSLWAEKTRNCFFSSVDAFMVLDSATHKQRRERATTQKLSRWFLAISSSYWMLFFAGPILWDSSAACLLLSSPRFIVFS